MYVLERKQQDGTWEKISGNTDWIELLAEMLRQEQGEHRIRPLELPTGIDPDYLIDRKRK